MYVEEFASTSKMLKLLEAFQIAPEEDIKDHTAICLHGFLKVYHISYAKLKNKKRDSIVSIFKDYKVIKLYNSTPSEYDQEVYRNIMCAIFDEGGNKYKRGLRKFLAEEKAEEQNDEEYESE